MANNWEQSLRHVVEKIVRGKKLFFSLSATNESRKRAGHKNGTTVSHWHHYRCNIDILFNRLQKLAEARTCHYANDWRSRAWCWTIPDDGKLVPHSRAHKTSSSHGPATLVLEGTDAFLFEQFLSKMRPTIQSNSDRVLVTGKGRLLALYRDLVASLCRRFDIAELPTPTEIRKAGATLAIDQGSNKATMEELAKQMTHSTSTSETYYWDRNRAEEAVKTFKKTGDWIRILDRSY